MSEKQFDWSDKGIRDFAKTAWVEACAVNPSNPLAVAQKIGEMVKACWAFDCNIDFVKPSEDTKALLEVLKYNISKVLSAITKEG